MNCDVNHKPGGVQGSTFIEKTVRLAGSKGSAEKTALFDGGSTYSCTMQKWRMKLDYENKDVIVDPRVTKLRLMRTVSRGGAP